MLSISHSVTCHLPDEESHRLHDHEPHSSQRSQRAITLIWIFAARMRFDGARIFHPRSVFGTSSNIYALNVLTASEAIVQAKVEIRPPPLRMNILRQGNIETALVTFLSRMCPLSFPSQKRSSTNCTMCSTNKSRLFPSTAPSSSSRGWFFSLPATVAGYIGCFIG